VPAKQPLTLADPAVQAAKAKWEKSRHKRKIRLSFDELFDLFQADCIRFSAIAKECGVCRQAVQSLYDRIFRDLLGDKAGQMRRASCTLENATVRTKKAESLLLSEDIMQRVTEKARAAGCQVSGVIRQRRGVPSGVEAFRLSINGHVCSVHTTFRWRPDKRNRWFARADLVYATLFNVDAAVFHTKAEGFEEHIFIVPSHILRSAYFAKRNRAAKSIYIPTEKNPRSRGPFPCIDWWKYEDAWRLIPPIVAAPVSS
jgi:hypothetical protein